MIKNITGVEKGSFRSLNGAADENVFIGKACKAGFYCFFKAWRDMPYDSVLEYASILYRVEVKGSSSSTFILSRGGRTGAQISRNAENRERRITREDCDFVVGVDSNNGDCYIIPVDILDICDRQNFSKKTLIPFKEKWNLFIYGNSRLSGEHTRDGILSLDIKEIRKIADRLGIEECGNDIKVTGMRGCVITEEKEKLVWKIWEKLANS